MDYESFHESLKYHLGKRGHGGQALVCRHTDIPRTYLSRIVKGGRKAGVKTQRKIARFFGLGLEEFVELGRRISLGQDPEAAVDLLQGLPEEQLLERLTAAVRKEMATARQLSRAQRLYESIVENSLQLILRFDAKLRLSYANQAAILLLDLERGPSPGQDWLAMLGEEGRRELAAKIGKLQGRGGSFALEVQGRSGRRWLHLTVTVFKEGAGECDLGQVIGFDITDKKRLTDRLVFIQHGVEMSYVPTLWVGADAGIVYANRALCQLLGYSRQELEQLHVWDINPLIPRENWQRQWALFEAEGKVAFSGQYRAKGGAIIPVEFQVSNLEYPDGRRYNVVFVKTVEGV